MMNIAELMSKEVLSAEEKALVESTHPEWAKEYLFHNFWNNTWLNLEVYSEVDKEQADLRKEMGI